MDISTQDFGYAVCNYHTEDNGIVVMGWKVNNTIPITPTFWDDVRGWFNEQLGTTVVIAGIIGESAEGRVLTEKLQGTDTHNKMFPNSGIPSVKNIRVLEMRDVNPEDWGLVRL